MHGQIGRAGVAKHVVGTVPPHRLQTIAGGAQRVAVIGDQRRAAKFRQPGGDRRRMGQ
jgi:hypothetical protein